MGALLTVLLDNYNYKNFNGPNDVWVDPGGGMCFIDPFYKRPSGKVAINPIKKKQRFFYLPKGCKGAAHWR